MSDHTKGPWFDLDDGHDTSRKIYGRDHKHSIATVHSYWQGPGPDRAERSANATLISAAPDLLEALRLVCDTYGFDTSVDSSVWQTAFAAINKATVPQPEKTFAELALEDRRQAARQAQGEGK